MPQQERGNWKPHNVKALGANAALVFRTGDIRRLNKVTYNFIILEMGFIAHYDLAGFKDAYRDLTMFREMLQTSEYSRDPDYNLRQATRYEHDRDFIKWYGERYCRSVAEGIRAIVAATRRQSKQQSLSLFQGERR